MEATRSADTRIVTLDIVRGSAVLGILAMNIIGFSMPEPAYTNPTAYGGSTGADLVLWAVNFIFVDGRMRGLFSFLFGASMLLIVERAEAKDENPAEIHYRRMIWLLLFGLLHLWFVWWGDILAQYAMIGMIAFAFRNLSVGGLIFWGIVFLAIETAHMAMVGSRYIAAADAAAAAGAGADVLRRWAMMSAVVGPLPPAELAADLALHRGPYWPLVVERLKDYPSIVYSLFATGPETLAYMLFGMAGLRSGFLAGQWQTRRYRIWSLTGFALSTPLFAFLALVIIRSDFHPAIVAALSLGATVPLRPIMIVAIAALIILFARRTGRIADRLAAAGRMAFTNYLLTSLVMTTFFYGHGLGYYGKLDRAEVYVVVIAMWALMLLWSKPWLDHFIYGPFEWLWRSLARASLQPMRRTAKPT